MTRRVLIVDDDPHIREVLVFAFAKAGIETTQAEDGEAAMAAIAQDAPDLVVLDINMPRMDGLEVCRRLRAAGYPIRILMATARDTVEDRIAGLDLGADDYVIKPYVLAELEARVRALLRRPATVVPVRLQVDDLALDTGTRIAERNGREISLTSKEYAVLEYLMRHPGEVVTRERISAHAWDDNYDPASNVIDVYIARLRRKIDAPGESPLLSTIRGAGYRLGGARHARTR